MMELLCVTGTVAILAAMLLPALARSRESARRTSCASQLSQLGTAFLMYAEENHGELPWSGGLNDAECLKRLYPEYMGDFRVFRCPSTQSASRPPEGGWPSHPTGRCEDGSLRCSYDYMGAYTERPIVMPPAPRPIPKIPVMWDMCFEHYGVRGFNHVPGGGNVLWLDGSVSFLALEDWADENLPAVPGEIPYIRPSETADDLEEDGEIEEWPR